MWRATPATVIGLAGHACSFHERTDTVGGVAADDDELHVAFGGHEQRPVGVGVPAGDHRDVGQRVGFEWADDASPRLLERETRLAGGQFAQFLGVTSSPARLTLFHS